MKKLLFLMFLGTFSMYATYNGVEMGEPVNKATTIVNANSINYEPIAATTAEFNEELPWYKKGVNLRRIAIAVGLTVTTAFAIDVFYHHPFPESANLI